VRVGHAGRRATGGDLLWQHTLNVPVPVDTGTNWLESYRRLAERIGAPFQGRPALEVPADRRERAAGVLRERGLAEGERALAVQVGVWPHQEWKQWPPRMLGEACSVLWRTRGLRPVLLGSDTGERTRRELRAAAPEVPFIDLVGSTTIGEAAAVLDRCAVSICNDSGLMHLSAAVGTPTVALYGMTDPEITWCYGPGHRVVRRQDCRPCYSVAPEVLAACPHKMCLAALPVDAVVAAAGELAEDGPAPLAVPRRPGTAVNG
ncbi:MAG TPA: glycosyltransferase family 9 protein, partial [Longimicrobiaceae bacterium]|nr:glycosyltransferase family 9 protein [Longimicrobiaceae bacterium]